MGVHDMNTELPEKREYTRSQLYYPLQLKLSSPRFLDKTYNGYIKNLSLNGVCILLEDRYKRFDMIEYHDSRIELEIEVPQGESLSFNTDICWTKKYAEQHRKAVLVGLEFNKISDQEQEQIKGISRIRKSDAQVLHTLFDQYMKQIS